MGLLDQLGRGPAQRGGGITPMALALVGLLGYQAVRNKGRLSEMLGGGGAGTATTGDPQATGAPRGLRDLAAGGGLGAGLKDLLGRFRQSGHEDAAQSWVSKGPNKAIAPHDLEATLGEERIAWLMQQTGLPRAELLDGLSRELPDAVDRLTPEGRLPTDEELTRLDDEPGSRPRTN
jgi:uncharacterized protein YidB (DUF937 family)